jgi:hypothetical protein
MAAGSHPNSIDPNDSSAAALVTGVAVLLCTAICEAGWFDMMDGLFARPGLLRSCRILVFWLLGPAALAARAAAVGLPLFANVFAFVLSIVVTGTDCDTDPGPTSRDVFAPVFLLPKLLANEANGLSGTYKQAQFNNN